jgi:hypothetical protein
MNGWDRDRWSNWAGDVVVEHPERRYHPAGLPDLLSIIRDAEATEPPRKVHACGSHWAFSDIAVSPDWFVETTDLRATRYDVLPTALNDRTRAELMAPASGPVTGLYHVEAGITVHDLNRRLDRRPLPASDQSWDRMPLDALGPDWPGAGKRWALTTMGGASGQTLAGAISTGTHGGDYDRPPMADNVAAIHLVGPGGRQWWLERDEGLTDPDRLRAALPGIEYRAGTELFDAALVAAGRMGIIYALVVRVVEQYGLEQTTVATTWTQARPSLRVPLPASARFLETVVVPYARSDGDHNCYQSSRREVPVPQGPVPARGPDFFALLCAHSTITPIVLVLLGATLAAMAVSWFIPVVGTPLFAVEAVALIALLGLLLFARMSLGALIGRACNFANRVGRSWIVRRLVETVTARARPTGVTRDVGYEIMDLSETGGQCYRGESVEVFFDAAAGTHLRFVDEEVFPAFAESAQAGRTVAGYVSMRLTQGSEALLAMQRWPVTGAIEVALLQGIDGNDAVLQRLQQAALRLGGTVHWGQHNTVDATRVRSSIPRLERWQAGLSEIAAGSDLFANDFCRRHGLEPAQDTAASRSRP